jgi:hypothetical protein
LPFATLYNADPMASQHLQVAAEELQAELLDAVKHVELLRRALAHVEELLRVSVRNDAARGGFQAGKAVVSGAVTLGADPKRADGTLAVTGEPSSTPSVGAADVFVGLISASPPARRPLLRDSIPVLLRTNLSGMTIKEITDALLLREWITGQEDSRIEMVRAALGALKREGMVVSDVPPGEKAAVWRMSNRMLGRPPAFSQAEQERGI